MPFQQQEYETAFHRFVEELVDAFVMADPLLGRVHRISLEDPAAVRSGTGPTHEPQLIVAEQRADWQAVLESNVESLRDVITETAQQRVTQMKALAYAQMNVVSAPLGELTWEVILDHYEQWEWSADPSGLVEPPSLFLHPEVASRLGDWTRLQQDRLQEIQARKQADWDARRRHRRIS